MAWLTTETQLTNSLLADDLYAQMLPNHAMAPNYPLLICTTIQFHESSEQIIVCVNSLQNRYPREWIGKFSIKNMSMDLKRKKIKNPVQNECQETLAQQQQPDLLSPNYLEFFGP